jgi:SSS family solute:Na+ symporter
MRCYFSHYLSEKKGSNKKEKEQYSMLLTTGHFIGTITVLALITVVGIYSGRKVKSSADFTTGGRKAGFEVVGGTIMGTLIGGASTIGTAQLAFQFGFSAWWFTLGTGIGCAVLGLGFARRIWESKLETIPQYLVKSYRASVGPIASIFTSVGIFFSLMVNILGYLAIMTAIFHIDPVLAAIIGVLLVLSYILFGGVWGIGMTGIVKVGFLYVAMLACGITAYLSLGGLAGMTAKLPYFPWFSLFGRGFVKDAAAGFSVVVGVLSTQTYFQAMASGKSVSASRKGALASAIMMPPVGLGGIMVGLFMRVNFPGTPSSEVFPAFVLNYLPPVLAGVVRPWALRPCLSGISIKSLSARTHKVKKPY